MNASLQKEFTSFEQKKSKLLSKLDSFSNPVLSQRPDESSWCVLQVLEHLEKIELAAITYLEKKLSHDAPLKKSGFMTNVKSFALHTALRIPFARYRAPKRLMGGNEPRNYEEIKESWSATRQRFQKILEPMSEELVHAEFFNNPNVGRIKIIQQMSFLNLHFDRHRKQVDKIISRVDT
ncbi:MAG: DinB family protein [Bacteroidota bacterium]